MAEVKGVLVTAMRRFLLDRYGKSAVDQALATLDPSDASLLKRPFLDSSFYPYATIGAVAALAHALTPIRRTTGQELGTFIADYVFTGPYKPFLAKDVVRMAEKIGSIEEFFYRDTNSVESGMVGETSCKVIYRYDHGVGPTRGACRSLGAFWGRALELAGGKKVATAHPACIAEGQELCEFRYSW